MRGLKIRSKLIIINLLIFLLIFISQFVFQNIFFDSYYNLYKERELKRSIEEFQNVVYDDDLANTYIKKVLEEKDIVMAYLDKELNVHNGDLTDSSMLTVKTYDNEVINLSTIFMSFGGFPINVGDSVEIDAVKYGESEELLIKNIKIVGKDEENSEISLVGDLEFPFKEIKQEVKIKGVVVSYDKVNEKIVNHKQAITTYMYFNNKGKLEEGKNTIDFLQQQYLIYVQKIDNNYILASISIEGSKEVIGILNRFNVYIVLLTLVLVIIIIYIYSRQITKPLIKMKEHAKAIANQDFDKEVSINSKDELQDLAESLNSISSNLKSNINELKETNKKLKEEYEERLEIEKNQKFLLMNISHDLKTPLTIIKGYLKAIKDGIYSKDEYIDYTIEGVDEISNTLNEMLEITKLKSKSYSLDIEAIDFTRLIYKTYDKLKYLPKEKNQIVRFNLIDDAFVKIDGKEMKKVLENLITNSINYSPNNMNINISLIEKHDKYIFTIENEGANIPEEDIKNIFKEFYRVDKSRNKKISGNGLGLVIVKSILEAHHIEFDIKNIESGVMFSIYLDKLE